MVKINVIYYYIVQKYDRLVREDHNKQTTVPKGNDRMREGEVACAEPIVLPCFDGRQN